MNRIEQQQLPAQQPQPPPPMPQQQHQPASHVLHQQASMYAHVSPVFGAPYYSNSNDNLMTNHNQLMRSKSLNDITNDSQVLAFAPGRSTNLHINQDNVNDANFNNIVDPNLMNAYDDRVNNSGHIHNNVTTQCMPLVDNSNSYNFYAQHIGEGNNIDSIQTNPNNNHTAPNNQLSNQQRNLAYNNQCSSNKLPTSLMLSDAATATSTPANMFNICNPLAMNMNGLTEQIGNLQL